MPNTAHTCGSFRPVTSANNDGIMRTWRLSSLSVIHRHGSSSQGWGIPAREPGCDNICKTDPSNLAALQLFTTSGGGELPVHPLCARLLFTNKAELIARAQAGTNNYRPMLSCITAYSPVTPKEAVMLTSSQ